MNEVCFIEKEEPKKICQPIFFQKKMEVFLFRDAIINRGVTFTLFLFFCRKKQNREFSNYKEKTRNTLKFFRFSKKIPQISIKQQKEKKVKERFNGCQGTRISGMVSRVLALIIIIIIFIIGLALRIIKQSSYGNIIQHVWEGDFFIGMDPDDFFKKYWGDIFIFCNAPEIMWMNIYFNNKIIF